MVVAARIYENLNSTTITASIPTSSKFRFMLPLPHVTQIDEPDYFFWHSTSCYQVFPPLSTGHSKGR